MLGIDKSASEAEDAVRLMKLKLRQEMLLRLTSKSANRFGQSILLSRMLRLPWHLKAQSMATWKRQKDPGLVQFPFSDPSNFPHTTAPASGAAAVHAAHASLASIGASTAARASSAAQLGRFASQFFQEKSAWPPVSWKRMPLHSFTVALRIPTLCTSAKETGADVWISACMCLRMCLDLQRPELWAAFSSTVVNDVKFELQSAATVNHCHMVFGRFLPPTPSDTVALALGCQ